MLNHNVFNHNMLNRRIHDSNNIMFACKLWGISSTDIMQGIVYGTRTNEIIDEQDHTLDFHQNIHHH